MRSLRTSPLAPMLDDPAIAAAMQQARVLGCPPTGRRCSFVPSTPEAALEMLTTDGWCLVGAIIDGRRSGPEWAVWFQVETGEVRRDRLA